MAFTLLINDVDRTSFIDNRSLRLREVESDEVDTLSFVMEIDSDDLSTIKPTGGDDVKLKDGSNVIFRGIIQRITESPLANKRFAEQIECDDLTTLFKAR